MRLQSIANESVRSGRRLVRGENGGSRCRIVRHPAILMLALLLFPFQVAFGIAPSNQTINNPVTDFNAVVQMDGFPGTSNAGGVNGPNGRMVGTGSIVMKFVGQNGYDYVCVLTADHVVSEPSLTGQPLPTDANAIGFGNSPMGGQGAPTEYKIIGSIIGGPTFAAGPPPTGEDLAMELVNVGRGPNATVAPGLMFNNIVPLTPVSLNNGVPTAGTNFTIVGFGNTGTTTDMTSYTLTPGSTGTKRFLDGTTFAPANNVRMSGPYTYNQVNWHPGFGNGAGTSFTGDSGAPMLVTSTVSGGMTNTYPTMTYTVNGTSYTIASSNISKDADGSGMLFGVHTFGTPRSPKTATSINGGVALTNADIAWITQSCNTLMVTYVPEPATWVLFAIGLSGVFVATRRSKSKAGAEGQT